MRLIVSLEKSMAIQLLPAANYDDDGGENGKSKILTAVVDAGWIFEIDSFRATPSQPTRQEHPNTLPLLLCMLLLLPHRFIGVRSIG